jgi:Domain of unknown function (DUF4190)/Septum formation
VTSAQPPWRPEAPPPPPPPPPPGGGGTSGFAIASLVFGIIGGIPLGIAFGIVALVRIKQRRQSGTGMAIAGITLSCLWLLAIGAIVIVALSTDAERDAGGRVEETGSESVFELRVGDCMNDLEETTFELAVEVTPCGEPHDGEAIAEFDMPEGDWPGMTAVTAAADERCGAALDSAAASAPRGLELEAFYFHPTEQSWDRGDRKVLCIALFPEPHRGALGPE